jgi:hypothetical protein
VRSRHKELRLQRPEVDDVSCAQTWKSIPDVVGASQISLKPWASAPPRAREDSPVNGQVLTAMDKSGQIRACVMLQDVPWLTRPSPQPYLPCLYRWFKFWLVGWMV